MFKKLIAVAALTVASVSGAVAAIYPSFQFDAASSSIDLTRTQDSCLGCGLNADFNAAALTLAPWTPTAADDQLRIDNLINWSVGPGIGGERYDVVVTLAFATPDVASGSTSGEAVVGSLFGVINGGILTWDGPGSISFAQGSVLDFHLDGVVAGGFGNSATTGVTFKGNDIAPVPLPASALLLLSAIAGTAAMRRRKASA